ncbi:MAG: glycosyltransferase [Microcoleaceae cyanobacterium]
MLFDLSVRGHHASYIQHLIQYWDEHHIPGLLKIVVTPRFLKEHTDVVNWASHLSRPGLEFIPISLDEETALNSRKSRFKRAFRNFQEWQILCRYAQELTATHCLILYFDTCELPLAWGVTSPCPFSGIYFRPTFHYPLELTHYQPTRADRIQQFREKIFLGRILKNPQLKNLFCLDPFAVKHLQRFKTAAQIVSLADPIEVGDRPSLSLDALKKQLGIEPSRRIFLLFGALTERKGVYQLLAAIHQLPPHLCEQLCLLLVGECGIASALDAVIDQLCQTQPVQIIPRYEFVSDSEVQTYFQLTDGVLAPYQKHVGMSGILLLAAVAGKPVLSSNYGLMGEIVQRHQLGITVDSTQPEDIAQGLTQFLQTEDWNTLCDAQQMRSFAEQNSAETFARTIFESL